MTAANVPGGRPLRSEEALAVDVLSRVFNKVAVTQHDDGSRPSMYDLKISGDTTGAAEVVRVTDSGVHGARAHWLSKLAGAHKSPRLSYVWAFSFTEQSSPHNGNRVFPRGVSPSATEIEDVLADLERRGVIQIGCWTDHTELDQSGAPTIPDPDIRRLHELLGEMIWDTEAVSIHDGRPGVFDIAFGYGSVATMDADAISVDIEARLSSGEFADVRSKLASSGLPERCAVIVLDDTSDAGYSMSALEDGDAPMAPITLPSEITSVVIISDSGVVFHFSPAAGWRRLDP